MKLGKKFAVLGAAALMLLSATGCSSKLTDAQTDVNNEVLQVLRMDDKVMTQTSNKGVDKFAFLGADFKPVEDIYQIDISGLASYNNETEKAYVNLQYDVEQSFFAGVDKEKDFEVVQALSQVIQNKQLKSLEFVQMSNVNNFNKTMGFVYESPVENFNHSTNLTYRVSDVEINKQDGYVSFKTQSNVKYSKHTMEMVYTVIGVDSDGRTKMGWALRPKTYYENFNQGHQIYIKANAEEISAMEKDSRVIFDKFVDVVKNKEKTEYTVRSLDISQDKVFEDGSEFSM